MNEQIILALRSLKLQNESVKDLIKRVVNSKDLMRKIVSTCSIQNESIIREYIQTPDFIDKLS